MINRQFPNSALTKAAETLLTEVSNPSMVNHCMRMYCFAELMSEKLRLKPDKEVLYIATLFHDLGLFAPYSGPGDFETNGAKAAEKFMLARGAEDSLAALVGSAIEVHTQFIAATDERPEVQLLHIAGFMDVFGARLDEVPPPFVKQLLNDYPRLDWKEMILNLMQKEMTTKPNCRMAQANRKFNLVDQIRNAPF